MGPRVRRCHRIRRNAPRGHWTPEIAPRSRPRPRRGHGGGRTARRAGLCAGLLFAALPTVSNQGHDARPYAVVTAAAVLASYLLVRAAQDPRPRWFAAYGLSLALVGYLQLFGLLLVPAHAVTVIGLGRRRRAAGDGQPGDAPRAAAARGGLVTILAVGGAVGAGWWG